MGGSKLIEVINYPNAARAHRLKAAKWVLDHPDCLEELLQIALVQDDKQAEKAAWALEFAFLEDELFILPSLSYLFEKLGCPTRDSIVRPLSHICEKVCIAYYKQRSVELIEYFSPDHRQKLVEAAFDWLINDFRTACKVRAMTCLYYLGTEFAWIHPELRAILTDNMYLESPGYQNRAKKILARIETHQLKSP